MGLHDCACVHEGGGRWVASNKLVELKKRTHKLILLQAEVQCGSHWANIK